jgi:small-conductance mechanosensitive channel
VTTYLRVESELRFAITGALKEAGIEIPFPQRDIHLRSTDAGPLTAGADPANGIAEETVGKGG